MPLFRFPNVLYIKTLNLPIMPIIGPILGNMKRLESEAVKIKHTSGQMNRQEEWRQIRLLRLALS